MIRNIKFLTNLSAKRHCKKPVPSRSTTNIMFLPKNSKH